MTSKLSLQVFLGWDPRETVPYAVAEASIRAHASVPVDIQPVRLDALRQRGWYTRPTERRDGRLWDVISDAPMATEHAVARFFVPLLAGYEGWALFADCDILLRADIAELFALADERYALQVVQHDYQPADGTKMDGQVQTAYARKLWSSVMLLNCGHPAHRALDLDLVNGVPGRDLHRFCWLADEAIGALPEAWNYLVGVGRAASEYTERGWVQRLDVKLAHFTLGTPDMPRYEQSEFAVEWRARLCDVADPLAALR